MISNDTTPPKRTTHDYTWQTLIEFTLSGEAGSEYMAADRVVEAMQTLNWSAVSLEQLKLTLTTAVRNVMERSHLDRSDASLIIRVLIPEESETPQEAGQAGDEPNKGQISEETTQQISRSSSRGWGFFLIQKQADETPTSVEKSPHLIELFLYRERKPGRK